MAHENFDQLEVDLIRAWELFMEDGCETVETELGERLPRLIDAGYVHEEPWGKDYQDSDGWSLWHFTRAGADRASELEAARGAAEARGSRRRE